MSIAPQRQPFFVYGTLLPGQPNSSLWDGQIVRKTAAVFDGGNLYDLGFFPMLVEEQGGSVRGLVIEVAEAAYQKILTNIDHLEGFIPDQPESSTYRRLGQTVRLADGSSRKVWLYAGRKNFVQGLSPIPSGDWLAYTTGKTADLATWWSSVNTVYGYQDNLKNE